MKTKVFCYGTLKRGHCRGHVLEDQDFLGEATTTPNYRLYNLGSYPGMVFELSGNSIKGEVWEVDEQCLRRLNGIEGISFGLFKKDIINLQEDLGTVFGYLYNQSVKGLKDCGESWEIRQ